jgi:hypothetical protein
MIEKIMIISVKVFSGAEIHIYLSIANKYLQEVKVLLILL